MPRKKKSEPVVAAPQEVVTTVPDTPKEETKPDKAIYKVRFPFSDMYNFEKKYAKGDVIEGWEKERIESALERGLIIAE